MDGLNRFIMNTYNWSALEFRLVIVKILNRFNQILNLCCPSRRDTYSKLKEIFIKNIDEYVLHKKVFLLMCLVNAVLGGSYHNTDYYEVKIRRKN